MRELPQLGMFGSEILIESCRAKVNVQHQELGSCSRIHHLGLCWSRHFYLGISFIYNSWGKKNDTKRDKAIFPPKKSLNPLLQSFIRILLQVQNSFGFKINKWKNQYISIYLPFVLASILCSTEMCRRCVKITQNDCSSSHVLSKKGNTVASWEYFLKNNCGLSCKELHGNINGTHCWTAA